MPRLRIHRLAARMLVPPLAAATLLTAPPSAAEDPEVIKRLRLAPVTIFDSGLKRLRRSAMDAANRLQKAPGTGPQTRVWYDPKGGTIEIEFRFAAAPQAATVTKEQCQEMRRAAIRETFDVGKTIYTTPLSFEERVRRRLANFFVLEPVETVKEVVAMGQRMARLTYLRITVAGAKDDLSVTCRGTVAPEVGEK